MVRVDLHSDPDADFIRKRQQQHAAAVKAYEKRVKAAADLAAAQTQAHAAATAAHAEQVARAVRRGEGHGP